MHNNQSPVEGKRIGGILLAAGASERMQKPKQLLNWRGRPLICQSAQNGLEAGLRPLIVITGANQAVVEDAIEHLAIQIIYNPDWRMGQSTSMKAGLRALPENCDGAVFLICDQPQVSPLLIRQLVEKRVETGAPIVAPQVDGQHVNPVLFGRETFQALMEVTGDQGGRAVFKQFEVEWLPWTDNRLLLDIDTAGDLERLERAYFP